MPVVREPKAARSSKRGRRLLFLIFLFFITILIILFFDSSLSKITNIEVRGNHYISSEKIIQLSEVEEEDQYFTVFTSTITEKIKVLPEVKSVKVSKQFPGRLFIEIEEFQEVALELESDGSLHVVLENGVNVPFSNELSNVNLPILRYWDNDADLRLQLCRSLATISPQHLADVSEIHLTPSVSYPDKLKIYTRSMFEVVTNISYLAEKLPLLENIIHDMQQLGNTSGEITMLEGNSGKSFESTEEQLEG